MKMGLFSFLFGVGLLFEIGLLHHVNAQGLGGLGELSVLDALKTQKAYDCFYKAIEDDADLAISLGVALCGKQPLSDESLEALYAKGREALVSTSCAVTDIPKLPEMGTTAAGLVNPVAKEAVDLLLKVTDKNRETLLPEKVSKSICGLVGPTLKPECLPDFLKKDTVKIINDVYTECDDDITKALPVGEVTEKLGKLIGCVSKIDNPLNSLKKREEVTSILCEGIQTAIEFTGAKPS